MLSRQPLLSVSFVSRMRRDTQPQSALIVKSVAFDCDGADVQRVQNQKLCTHEASSSQYSRNRFAIVSVRARSNPPWRRGNAGR